MENNNDYAKYWYDEKERCRELSQQLDQLKAEKEELKNAYARLNSLYNDNCNFTGKLEQTLTEIKPIVELYANSKMGEEQPDRTYKIMCSGDYIMVYDPKPAREALQKISEVLNDK